MPLERPQCQPAGPRDIMVVILDALPEPARDLFDEGATGLGRQALPDDDKGHVERD